MVFKVEAIRTFPILKEKPTEAQSFVPWWMAEAAYEVYQRRHGNRQSLERIAERGGFGRDEILDLLADR